MVSRLDEGKQKWEKARGIRKKETSKNFLWNEPISYSLGGAFDWFIVEFLPFHTES